MRRHGSRDTSAINREERRAGRRGRADATALVALAALQLGFLWRAVWLRGFFVQSDICYYFEPAKGFMHDALRAGRLPLWCPYIFCGYPIASEGQIATFYPLSVLISWLLPSPAAVNWLLISHLMLAAVSMYLLCRAIGLTPFGAWLSAFVFSFSGYLFAHLHHVSLVCAAAWLPLVLLAVEGAWTRRSMAFTVLAALGWAASALCGHPQTLFYISLSVIFWVGWRMFASRRAGEQGYAKKAVALAAAIFVLGVGLASVQLLLTADLSSLAPHGERGDLRYVTSFSLLPKHLVGLIAPNWEGTPAFNTYTGERYYWEYVLYVGLAPLLLALVGSFGRQGRVWAAFALVALVLALAKGNPLYLALRFVPGFSEFRVPARHILLFTFAAAILAGHGWQVLTRWRPLSGSVTRTAVAAGIALLSILDLFSFDKTLAPTASPQVYAETPRVVQTLAQDDTWGRCLIIPPIEIFADWSPPEGWAGNPDGWLEARVYLPASVPLSYGLRTIGGYAGFVDPRQTLFFQQATALAFQQHDVTLLSLVGTRYFVLGTDLELPHLPRADIPPFKVYRNPDSFPRAFAVGHVASAQDYAGALERTVGLAHRGELRQAAVIRGSLGDWQFQGNAAEIARVREHRPEHIEIRVHCEGDVLVVLNERWDPGWVARVDGESAPLFEVDSVLMGAPVPAGEHTVEFVYRPRGLVTGRALSLVSLAVCAFILLGARLRARSAAGES